MRILALVDGFNVYHSLGAAETAQAKIDAMNARNGKAPQALGGRNFRWFNIPQALASRMPLIGKTATISRSIYFSAYAHHAGSDRVDRHRLYVELLEGLGVEVQMSNFKKKEISCPRCRGDFTRMEEKETDVAIACAILSGALDPAIDAFLLFTGDTDQLPAIRLAKSISPGKPVYTLFPFDRQSRELKSISTASWNVDIKSLDRWRFPKTVTLPSGKEIVRPPVYDG